MGSGPKSFFAPCLGRIKKMKLAQDPRMRIALDHERIVTRKSGARPRSNCSAVWGEWGQSLSIAVEEGMFSAAWMMIGCNSCPTF